MKIAPARAARTAMLTAILAALSPLAHGFTIVPTFVDGDTQTWDATKQAVVNQAISEWAALLSYTDPNQSIPMTFKFLHPGVSSYLGQWHGSFSAPSGVALDPWSPYMTHEVDINADLMVPRAVDPNHPENQVTLLFTQGAITSSNWDALSVVRHELGHALGFSNLYLDVTGPGLTANHYADHVTGSVFDANPGGLNIQLASASNITHLADPDPAHALGPKDLMNVSLANGVQRSQSFTDLQMLCLAEGYGVTVPFSFSYTADTLRLGGPLTVSGNLSLTTTAGTRQTANVLGIINGLTIDSGLLNLANHDLIIRGGQPVTDIRTLVNTGKGNGTWNGTVGITSSTANADGATLAYATAGALGFSTFDQTSVSATDILVKYTYPGDVNFDGKVDIADLNILAGHWQSAVNSWALGDLNGDGNVTITDLNLLAGSWQRGTAGNGVQLLLPAFIADAIPEPTSLSFLTLTALPLLTRRKPKIS